MTRERRNARSERVRARASIDHKQRSQTGPKSKATTNMPLEISRLSKVVQDGLELFRTRPIPSRAASTSRAAPSANACSVAPVATRSSPPPLAAAAVAGAGAAAAAPPPLSAAIARARLAAAPTSASSAASSVPSEASETRVAARTEARACGAREQFHLKYQRPDPYAKRRHEITPRSSAKSSSDGSSPPPLAAADAGVGAASAAAAPASAAPSSAARAAAALSERWRTMMR